MPEPVAPRCVELWYEFASTYSYLSVARIEKVAEAARIEVRWRPFLLGPIFREQGLTDSPFNVYPVKGRYMWRDLERLCEGYQLPFRKPSEFPRNGILAARVATFAEAAGFAPEFSRAVFHANFAEDLDISSSAVISGILETLGRDPAAALATAESPGIKEQLRARTAEAQAAGIFGAPSFRVGSELYWGNDRLGNAIAHCALG